MLLVDPGNTADPDALVAAGVDLRTLTIASPSTAAQAWTILDVMTRCGALDVILVSSLSSLLLLPGAATAGRVEKRLARLWLEHQGTAYGRANHQHRVRRAARRSEKPAWPSRPSCACCSSRRMSVSGRPARSSACAPLLASRSTMAVPGGRRCRCSWARADPIAAGSCWTWRS